MAQIAAAAAATAYTTITTANTQLNRHQPEPTTNAKTKIQTCRTYTDNGGMEEAYCADTCAPGVCGDGESCTLEQSQCDGLPCPPVVKCDRDIYVPPGTEYVGCVRDNRADRVLQHKHDDHEMTNDVRSCFNSCAAGCRPACPPPV